MIFLYKCQSRDIVCQTWHAKRHYDIGSVNNLRIIRWHVFKYSILSNENWKKKYLSDSELLGKTNWESKGFSAQALVTISIYVIT